MLYADARSAQVTYQTGKNGDPFGDNLKTHFTHAAHGILIRVYEFTHGARKPRLEVRQTRSAEYAKTGAPRRGAAVFGQRNAAQRFLAHQRPL